MKFIKNTVVFSSFVLIGAQPASAQDPQHAHEHASSGALPDCCAAPNGHGHEDAHGHARAHADVAPISVMGGHAHPQGDWMLSYRFMRMDMDGMRNGTDRLSSTDVFARGYTVAPVEMTMDMHMVGVMYAPTDEITLMLMAHYIDSRMEHRLFSQMAANMINGGATEFTTRAEGIGDTSLTLLYNLHAQGNRHLVAGIGVSLPTGSIDESDRLPAMGGPRSQVLPASMQLGSGTYDLLPSLTCVHQLDDWSYGAQATGVIRLEDRNSRDYRLGHVFEATTWASYLLPYGFSLNGGLSYRYTGTLKGEQEAINPMGPNGRSVPTAIGSNYGGERIEGLIGFNFEGQAGALKGHRIGIDLRLPVWQDLNGLRLETDSVVTVGWQKTF